MAEKILVTGASGQQGGAVARSLIRQGVAVRALSRTPEKLKELKALGAETVKGDLTDPASLDAALKGIKKAFLVTSPFEGGPDAEVIQGGHFVDAAKRAGLDHLVFATVVDPSAGTGVPLLESKGKVIELIKKAGIPATILKPVWFMENFGTYFLPLLQSGKVAFPLPSDYQLDMVSLDVIGDFAARAFSRPAEYLNQTVEVASDSLPVAKAIAAIAKRSGKEISYEQLPGDKAEGAFGPLFASLFEWFRKTNPKFDLARIAQRGVPLTKFDDFLAREDWEKKLAPAELAGKN